MSGNKQQPVGKYGGSGGPMCPNDCGYDAANQRHNESYWEGRTDPREKLDDKDMRFNTHYYKVVDRQISANHQQYCIDNDQGEIRGIGHSGQSGQSGAGQSGQSGARK